MKYKPDFFSDGKFRIYDHTELGSSIVDNDKLIPSVFSVNYLKTREDYYPISDITIGELFCGAGIGAIGSKNLGLDTIYAYDNNKHAVSTYNKNIHPVATLEDLKTKPIKDIPYTDIIMAGFPCQPFSFNGKGLGVNDKDKPARTILSSPKGKNSAQILKWENQPHRRYTVRESLRLQTVPDWFVFDDNVPLMKQYERCSGIPPLISELFLKQLSDIIKNNNPL